MMIYQFQKNANNLNWSIQQKKIQWPWNLKHHNEVHLAVC